MQPLILCNCEIRPFISKTLAVDIEARTENTGYGPDKHQENCEAAKENSPIRRAFYHPRILPQRADRRIEARVPRVVATQPHTRILPQRASARIPKV